MSEYFNDFLMLLQNSLLGKVVRSTEYLYPLLEASHILGIAILIGPAFIFDLRLLGVGDRSLSVVTAARKLLPVSRVGFAVSAITGMALFSAQATVVAQTGAAPWKLFLLLIACINVLVFHLGIYRRASEWSEARAAPLIARAGAGVSIISWTGVVIAGRLMAYT